MNRFEELSKGKNRFSEIMRKGGRFDEIMRKGPASDLVNPDPPESVRDLVPDIQEEPDVYKSGFSPGQQDPRIQQTNLPPGVSAENVEHDYDPGKHRDPITDILVKAPARGLAQFESTFGSVGQAFYDQIARTRRDLQSYINNPQTTVGKLRQAVGQQPQPNQGEAVLSDGNDTWSEKRAEEARQNALWWLELQNHPAIARDPDVYSGSFTENPSFQRLAGKAMESLPSMALGMIGGPAVGGAVLAMTDAMPEYTQMRETGVSEFDALMYTAFNLYGAYKLEGKGLEMILGQNPAMQKVISKLGNNWLAGAAINYAAEGSQEGLQQIWQNAVAMGYDGDKALLEDALESALSGGLLGAAGGAVAKAAGKRSANKQEIKQEAQNTRKEFLSELVASIGDPESAQETVLPDGPAREQTLPVTKDLPPAPVDITPPEGYRFKTEEEKLQDKGSKPSDNTTPGASTEKLPTKRDEVKSSTPTAQDLDAKADYLQSGGYIEPPSAEGLAKIGRSVKRFGKRWFAGSQGMDKSTRQAALNKMYGEEAARVEGMFTRNAFKTVRKRLSSEHGRDKVQQALQSVVYGEMAPEQFGLAFGLKPDDAAVKTLQDFNRTRTERSAAIADVLEKSGNQQLAERVREDEAYVSRFYLKHAMGDEFVPSAEDYKAAVTEIRAGIEDAIEALGRRADRAAGKSGKFQRQVVEYLNTGNESALQGLSESRTKEITLLRKQFSKVSQVIDSVSARDGGGLDMAVNTAALNDAAEATVKYYMTRDRGPGGRPDISNLKKRFLGEAFRKLYGEVNDPVYAAAATAENQARLLSQLTFFNRLALESENKAWSGMPSEELGTSKRLDDDSRKYGLLAGKYVTPELYEAIHGESGRQAVTKMYTSALATMRLLKLIGPKTIARNYATALTGFSLGSGDAMRPGFWGNFKRGNALVRGIVKGDPAATAELKRLVGLGVFSFHGNTQMEEVQRLFTIDPRKKVGLGLKAMGDLYSMIDLPSKAAAFYTNVERFQRQGMNQAEAEKAAALHVQQHYQNPRALPKAAFKMSRLPISDFVGYFWDSARIRGNQVAHAVASARQGDLIPATGLMLSGMLAYGLTDMFGKEGRKLWRKARKALRKDKSVTDVTEVKKDQQRSLRYFMPDYYENAPMIVWRETDKKGKQRLFYTITGGNSAFPIEDMLIGSMQGADSFKDFMGRLGESVAENRLGPGMLPSALYKAATGDDLQGGFHTTGIVDVLGTERPDKDKIFRDSFVRLLSDVYGGQFGSKAMQMYDHYQKQKAGVERVAGSYTPYQTYAGILGSMFDPARTYEINVDEAARMVRNRLSPYAKGLSVAKGMTGAQVMGFIRHGAATKAQERSAATGQQARKEYIAKAGEILNESRKAFAGVLNEAQLRAIVSDSIPGASKIEIMMILGGAKKEEVSRHRPQPGPTNLQLMMGDNRAMMMKSVDPRAREFIALQMMKKQ